MKRVRLASEGTMTSPTPAAPAVSVVLYEPRSRHGGGNDPEFPSGGRGLDGRLIGTASNAHRQVIAWPEHVHTRMQITYAAPSRSTKRRLASSSWRAGSFLGRN